MKCVLHIGTEKTGTTTIQDWMYFDKKNFNKNKIFLSDQFNYFNTNRHIPTYFMNKLDDFTNDLGIKNLDDKNYYFRHFERNLTDEISQAKNNYDIFLISSEHFHSRITEEAEIKSLYKFLTKNFKEIKVICYFRNQADMAISHYSTALRLSYDENIENYIKEYVFSENMYFNFLNIADFWSTAFGIERCDFRLYDRNKFKDNDVRIDFINAIDPKLNIDTFNFKIPNSNESISSVLGSIYKSINNVIPPLKPNNSGWNPLNREVKKIFREKPEFNFGKFKLDDHNNKTIEKEFKKSNDLFFKKYFNSKNIFITSKKNNTNYFEIDQSSFDNIIESLVSLLLKFKMKNETPDITFLRDIAIKIENEEKLNIEDALKIMKFCKLFKPDGPIINQKIKQWETLEKK